MRTLVETAGAIAHEINQPLSVIVGRTQLLQRRTNCTEAIRTAEILQKAGKRISTITKKMQRACSYTTKEYGNNDRIIDFDQTSE
ncbi:MAG: signal transduction histidine kinase [Planctomycetota bacterium]